MDIGMIIAVLLQIGLGIAMVMAARYGKKKFTEKQPSNMMKTGVFVASVWGWMMILLSTYNLIIYLFAPDDTISYV